MAAMRKTKSKRPWEDVAKEAQDYRDASIWRVPGITDISGRLTSLEESKWSIDTPSMFLESKDVQITQCLPEDLVAMLGRGELSAVEVTTAFLRRAALAQKLVSYI